MTTPETTTRELEAACATVASEIARTDSKASLLLAFDGAALAGLASAHNPSLPTTAKTAGALAALLLGIAAAVLLLVVRPSLSATDRASFPHWARLPDTALRAALTTADTTRPARLRTLSTLALRKYTLLRRAVDLILTALAPLAIAAATTL